MASKTPAPRWGGLLVRRSSHLGGLAGSGFAGNVKGSVAQVSQIALFVRTWTPPKRTVCWRSSGALPEMLTTSVQLYRSGSRRAMPASCGIGIPPPAPGWAWAVLADGADVSHAEPASTAIARSETADAT